MGKVIDIGFLTPDSGISLGGLRLTSHRSSTPNTEQSQKGRNQEAPTPGSSTESENQCGPVDILAAFLEEREAKARRPA